MTRLAILVCGLILVACSRADMTVLPDADRPMRIVSLDYCADQYVLRLADRTQILAVSPDARGDFSYMRGAAEGLATLRPVAEDILIARPDLIVRAYGGGPNATALFERAGIPVLQVGWTTNVQGEGPGSVAATIRDMAEGLGQSERGDALAGDYLARLATISRNGSGQTAMYATPGGVTSGPGSLIHEMLTAAGLDNFEPEPGWRPIPLERLAYDTPDRFIFADFEGGAGPWSAARHPVFANGLEETPVTRIEGAWTACGGWFIIKALEAMAEPAG